MSMELFKLIDFLLSCKVVAIIEYIIEAICRYSRLFAHYSHSKVNVLTIAIFSLCMNPVSLSRDPFITEYYIA